MLVRLTFAHAEGRTMTIFFVLLALGAAVIALLAAERSGSSTIRWWIVIAKIRQMRRWRRTTLRICGLRQPSGDTEWTMLTRCSLG